MATYGLSSGTVGVAADSDSVRMVRRLIDFDDIINNQGITVGSTDVFQAIDVPINTVVVAAGIQVVTAESTNTTSQVALGDGSVTYVASATFAATGSMTSVDAIGEVGVSYDAANTLDCTLSVAAPTDAKLLVWAVLAEMRGPNVVAHETWS